MNVEIGIACLSFIRNAVCTPIVRLSRVEIQCHIRLLGLVYYSKKEKTYRGKQELALMFPMLHILVTRRIVVKSKD